MKAKPKPLPQEPVSEEKIKEEVEKQTQEATFSPLDNDGIYRTEKLRLLQEQNQILRAIAEILLQNGKE